ncbi:MAG: S-ribosylhomocysteine lyase [Spirochaetaceae bacterium 4572_59]|nr:MAG: S-ribosylhomocysteine lyase [Spirochaetaceae bacterium 4572_59]
MDKIPSFSIDHKHLLRGIYLSRQDTVGKEVLTTFDIRIKEPNREPVMDNAALHTIEHLGATFLRNDPQWAEKTVYFGPMGCRTGCYVIFKGDLTSKDVLPLITDMFRFIADFNGDIPGATARDCGNYLEQNLDMAKWESRKYLNEVLTKITDANLNYPE